jgi:hypothetical protein
MQLRELSNRDEFSEISFFDNSVFYYEMKLYNNELSLFKTSRYYRKIALSNRCQRMQGLVLIQNL